MSRRQKGERHLGGRKGLAQGDRRRGRAGVQNTMIYTCEDITIKLTSLHANGPKMKSMYMRVTNMALMQTEEKNKISSCKISNF